MKRITAFIAACALALGLVGCGGAASSSTPAEPKDYAQIIHDSRASDFNEAFMTVSPAAEGEGYVAVDGFAADYTEPGQLDSFANDMVLPLLGLDATMYDTFSASVSLMMTNCYGVAIVDPAEGQTETVVAALENYVVGQQAAFEFYLEDQFQIAQTGTVTVADSGEVVLVCCADGEAVQAAILAALAE